MKDAAFKVHPEPERAGRLGLSGCAYACPGCPASRHADALRVRVIGDAEDAILKFRHAPLRDLELASGVLPLDIDVWRNLRALGFRRALTPIFGLDVAHDREANVPPESGDSTGVMPALGAFAKAIASLTAAHAAGLSPILLATASRQGGPPKRDILRVLYRLAWTHRWSVEVAAEGSAPCIADSLDYNSLYP